MQIHEAAKILKHNYNTAPERGMVLAIHLFAIKYADDIKDMPLKKLVKEAGLGESYHTEIRKGINIAQWVTPKY